MTIASFEPARSEPPTCLGPVARPTPPRIRAPRGSWDTHFHIFGPPERFPYYSERKYTPPTATLESFQALCDLLGIERGVCVQPNLHGADNSVTLDCVERSDGRFLAIVKVENSVTFPELKQLHRRGARGVRFAFNPEHGGEFDSELFRQVCLWAGDLGWCVDLHLAPSDLGPLCDVISRAGANVVIDHMARVNPVLGLQQQPFRELIELVSYDHVWVKMSGADRITKEGPPYMDVKPFARALIEASPQRVIWGSDWPHSAYFDSARVPDDGKLLDFLIDAVPTDLQQKQILIDNPRRLFGG
ncbi:amidohydrolase family protein [Pseudolabrys sp.]|uniref:amidohydrolase family protein n=1 Tax=Pseudolabrys sp. TaxID=1960880 RepID=UPI003D132C77